MTDKQIIIDGVDVSGCENALQGKHTILCAGSEYRALCDANKNCLYKKYKRKEQECEKFESRADELQNTLAKVSERISRIVEIDGNVFDEALANEIESIQNLIRKAIFEAGEIDAKR